MPILPPALPQRRQLMRGAGAALATLALPALASSRRVVVPMGDGPFYPPRAWREQWSDPQGRAIDAAEVEIWQCDAMAVYHHPGVRAAAGQFDDGFQGFGTTRSDAAGALRFRTIRPVPYPGRTPHIHIKLRHASFGTLSSQLFVADDPGNARDFLFRQLDGDGQAALSLALARADGDSGLRWLARHTLVIA
jgi:protocatechuate 3,4-dioxygenase beta subunit